jgi:hypothetical protein
MTVCGTKIIGTFRKGAEWWTEEVKEVVKNKKVPYHN